MKTIETPVLRLDYSSILRTFRASGKKHLILTGARGSGKSFLFTKLLPFLEDDIFCKAAATPIPCITTHAFPKDRVELWDNITGKRTVIGRYPSIDEHPLPGPVGNRMLPVLEGFLQHGCSAIQNATDSPSSWAAIDELGYLESCCLAFQQKVHTLFQRKRVLAVLRKQSTAFLDSLLQRTDVFLLDLDALVLPIGCVIMASGLSRRFGSNKLLETFDHAPLISHILDITGNGLFAERVVVTRHSEIALLCQQRNIPVVLHELPHRNDTVRLGLSYLLQTNASLAGCMFALSDQPLLTRESLETMVLSFSHRTEAETSICRLSCLSDTNELILGSPVLFGPKLFHELLNLPEGKGGGFLMKAYPELVSLVQAGSIYELSDADTPEALAQLVAQLEAIKKLQR